jgi:hypothetical protein
VTVGRPSIFTPEIAAAICDEIAAGRSLRTICDREDMPAKSTVFLWLSKNKDFLDQYVRAREAQADAMAEEILDIADDGTNDTYQDEHGNVRTDQEVIGRSRLRVDTRKWLMSKLAPKKYGEKITQEHSGVDGGPLVISWLK